MGSRDRPGKESKKKPKAKTGQRVAYHDLGSLFAGAHFANDLALDAQGFIAIDTYQRSTSHAQVFSVPDDSDALAREQLAKRLENSKRGLDTFTRALADAGQLAALPQFAVLHPTSTSMCR